MSTDMDAAFKAWLREMFGNATPSESTKAWLKSALMHGYRIGVHDYNNKGVDTDVA